ncbi:AgmX/PglI C-terminal domain-containing protein [Myxococcus landrumensis]|uniref:AgmX/PglI C-terminal domain-containing protein n=1 Tax=Myxococcus landrumensis TaxID=2813577 RepID=A0ABX7N1A3_9BACT|nr:AgmX/PglI C-terminal domain-containing protein [Myxococcus landrumus]QSQ11497.1 AgmX/PglI C-terminal domain-containing protein [Myxococcus landrumus]
MGEFLSGGEEQLRARGEDTSAPEAGDATCLSVLEALDEDLDAYLDRELADAPDADDAPEEDSDEEDADELRALLTLAEEEIRWLAQSPETAFSDAERAGAPVLIPAWMRENPSVAVAEPVRPAWAHAQVPSPPAPSRSLPWSQRASATPTRPNLQERPWGVPMWEGPPRTPHRGLDIVSGVLLGVAVVGALAAGMLVVASVRLWEVGTFRQVEVAELRAGAQRPSLADTRVPVESADLGTPVVRPEMRAPPPPVVGAIPSVTSSTSVGDIASTLQAPPAAPTLAAPASRATLDDTDALARRDTLAVTSRVRRAEEEAVEQEASKPAPEEAQASVQELTFEEDAAPEDSTPPPQEEAAVEEEAAESELDEEFARELGFADEAASEEPEPTAARTVYVPPELGEKEHLTADDVQQVVVAHQPDVTECLHKHAADSLLEKGGHFVVSWSVQPSGETTDVAMDTPALRSTPVASCIEGVVRGWKFPMHAVRMPAPIHFPFVF